MVVGMELVHSAKGTWLRLDDETHDVDLGMSSSKSMMQVIRNKTAMRRHGKRPSFSLRAYRVQWTPGASLLC